MCLASLQDSLRKQFQKLVGNPRSFTNWKSLWHFANQFAQPGDYGDRQDPVECRAGSDARLRECRVVFAICGNCVVGLTQIPECSLLNCVEIAVRPAWMQDCAR